MSKFDLISIGDSTIDVFMQINPSDSEVLCTLDDKECKIAFDYGAKIPVSKLTRVPGVGNAANNAIGSARLGLKTAIYTVIGDDQDSLEIKKIFEEEGVDTTYVVMEKNKRSNFSVVINYGPERNIFVYHEDREYTLPNLPPAEWVYFTSIGKGHEKLHKQLPAYVKKNAVKLGFNPGSHQLREGMKKLEPIMQVTEVLLVNKEEAYSLVGGSLHDITGLIRKLKEAGPKIVVITDGRNGSYASIDGREIWYLGIPQNSPVIERTGAGDAYSTGFLAALARKKTLTEAMMWGTMNATSVVQYIGARKGLLTFSKMQDFIRRYGSFLKPDLVR